MKLNKGCNYRKLELRISGVRKALYYMKLNKVRHFAVHHFPDPGVLLRVCPSFSRPRYSLRLCPSFSGREFSVTQVYGYDSMAWHIGLAVYFIQPFWPLLIHIQLVTTELIVQYTIERYGPTKLCDGAKMAIFCVLYLQRAACSAFQTCILNSH